MRKKRTQITQMQPSAAATLFVFADPRSPSRPSGRAALLSQVLRIRKSFGLARRFATLLHSPLRGSLSQTLGQIPRCPLGVPDIQHYTSLMFVSSFIIEWGIPSTRATRYLPERLRQQRRPSARTGWRARISKYEERCRSRRLHQRYLRSFFLILPTD